MSENSFKKAVIEVELLGLKARESTARDYCMNINMQIEANLLRAQIEALEKGLEDLA